RAARGSASSRLARSGGRSASRAHCQSPGPPCSKLVTVPGASLHHPSEAVNSAGVTELHPALRPYVERAAAAAPAWEQTLEALRAGPELENPEIWGEPDDVASVEDRFVGSLRVRVYRPAADRPLPGLVWLHGGGWVVGSLDSHDGL